MIRGHYKDINCILHTVGYFTQGTEQNILSDMNKNPAELQIQAIPRMGGQSISIVNF